MAQSAMPSQPRILRRIYASQYPCPACGSVHLRPRTSSPSREYRVVYRVCAQCAAIVKIPLLGVEIEGPDGRGILQIL
jgi:hypothetical protein